MLVVSTPVMPLNRTAYAVMKQRLESIRPAGLLGSAGGYSRFTPSLIDWYRSCIVSVKQEIVAWRLAGTVTR